MGAEIGAQTVADNVDAVVVDQPCELVDLVGGQKLHLIDKKPVDETSGLFA